MWTDAAHSYATGSCLISTVVTGERPGLYRSRFQPVRIVSRCRKHATRMQRTIYAHSAQREQADRAITVQHIKHTVIPGERSKRTPRP